MNSRQGISVFQVIAVSIVILISGSLGSLFLQQARSKSELVKCGNQLRQITLASHNYHDAFRQLPAATIGDSDFPIAGEWLGDMTPNWQDHQNTSSLFLLAPFLELNQISDKVDPVASNFRTNLVEYVDHKGDRLYSWQGEIRGMGEVIFESPDVLHCPSDDIDAFKGATLIATQLVTPTDKHPDDIAVVSWEDEAEANEMGRTNYLANVGPLGGTQIVVDDGQWLGPMKSRSGSRLGTITDGTSRTIMYGESLGEIQEGERKSAQAWVWGGIARGRGNVEFGETYVAGDEARGSVLGNLKNSSAVGFGSNHEDVVIFTFCDSSTHYFSRDIDLEVFYQLCAAFDGGVPPIPDTPAGVLQELRESRRRSRSEPEVAPVTERPRVTREEFVEILRELDQLTEATLEEVQGQNRTELTEPQLESIRARIKYLKEVFADPATPREESPRDKATGDRQKKESSTGDVQKKR